jgi:hypothetical protein
MADETKKEPLVAPEDYVEALVQRLGKMNNEEMGRFVRNTLWTASTNLKRGEHGGS